MKSKFLLIIVTYPIVFIKDHVSSSSSSSSSSSAPISRENHPLDIQCPQRSHRRLGCLKGQRSECDNNGDCKHLGKVCCHNDCGQRRCMCPYWSKEQDCGVNLCSFSTCPAIPGAICRMNNCGECQVKWFKGKKDVTHRCFVPRNSFNFEEDILKSNNTSLQKFPKKQTSNSRLDKILFSSNFDQNQQTWTDVSSQDKSSHHKPVVVDNTNDTPTNWESVEFREPTNSPISLTRIFDNTKQTNGMSTSHISTNNDKKTFRMPDEIANVNLVSDEKGSEHQGTFKNLSQLSKLPIRFFSSQNTSSVNTENMPLTGTTATEMITLSDNKMENTNATPWGWQWYLQQIAHANPDFSDNSFTNNVQTQPNFLSQTDQQFQTHISSFDDSNHQRLDQNNNDQDNSHRLWLLKQLEHDQTFDKQTKEQNLLEKQGFVSQGFKTQKHNPVINVKPQEPHQVVKQFVSQLHRNAALQKQMEQELKNNILILENDFDIFSSNHHNDNTLNTDSENKQELESSWSSRNTESGFLLKSPPSNTVTFPVINKGMSRFKKIWATKATQTGEFIRGPTNITNAFSAIFAIPVIHMPNKKVLPLFPTLFKPPGKDGVIHSATPLPPYSHVILMSLLDIFNFGRISAWSKVDDKRQTDDENKQTSDQDRRAGADSPPMNIPFLPISVVPRPPILPPVPFHPIGPNTRVIGTVGGNLGNVIGPPVPPVGPDPRLLGNTGNLIRPIDTGRTTGTVGTVDDVSGATPNNLGFSSILSILSALSRIFTERRETERETETEKEKEKGRY